MSGIKRFTGLTHKQVMTQVREELGEGAMILSNKRIEGGYEVLAATDESIQQVAQTYAPPKPEAKPGPTPQRFEFERFDRRDASSIAMGDDFPLAPEVTAYRQNKGSAAYAAYASAVEPSASPAEEDIPAPTPVISPVEAEALMEVFEAELVEPDADDEDEEIEALPTATERFQSDLKKAQAITDWSGALLGDLQGMQDLIRRKMLPRTGQLSAYAALHQCLIRAGFATALSNQILSALPAQISEQRRPSSELMPWLEQAMCAQVKVMASPEIWWGGRCVLALVGSSGVGKSSTAVKIAARFVADNDPGNALIVSIDPDHTDTLRSYAEVLGIAFKTVATYESLEDVLSEASAKQLVLIDTPGLGYRSKHLEALFARLGAAGNAVKPVLVLNAASEADSLEATTQAYLSVSRSAGIAVEQCVITKLDEAVRTGAVLGSIMRHQLTAAYQSSGTDLLHDFDRPSALMLVRDSLVDPGFECGVMGGGAEEGAQFEMMRKQLLENITGMCNVLNSVRREFKQAGMAEAGWAADSLPALKRQLPYGLLSTGTAAVQLDNTPVSWHYAKYPVDCSFLQLTDQRGQAAS
jgi:flagellar biosynthesis protein FlhF